MDGILGMSRSDTAFKNDTGPLLLDYLKAQGVISERISAFYLADVDD